MFIKQKYKAIIRKTYSTKNKSTLVLEKCPMFTILLDYYAYY